MPPNMPRKRFQFVPEINLGHMITGGIYLITLVAFLVRIDSRLATVEASNARQDATLEKVTDAQLSISRTVDRLTVLEEQRSKQRTEFRGQRSAP